MQRLVRLGQRGYRSAGTDHPRFAASNGSSAGNPILSSNSDTTAGLEPDGTESDNETVLSQRVQSARKRIAEAMQLRSLDAYIADLKSEGDPNAPVVVDSYWNTQFGDYDYARAWRDIYELAPPKFADAPPEVIAANEAYGGVPGGGWYDVSVGTGLGRVAKPKRRKDRISRAGAYVFCVAIATAFCGSRCVRPYELFS